MLYRRRRSQFSELVPNSFAERSCNKICSNQIKSNRGKLQRQDVWFYNKEVLDIVDAFTYLGMMFNYNGKFSKTQKHASEKGKKSFVFNMRKFK